MDRRLQPEAAGPEEVAILRKGGAEGLFERRRLVPGVVVILDHGAEEWDTGA